MLCFNLPGFGVRTSRIHLYLCQAPASLSPWCGIVLPNLAHCVLGTVLGWRWALEGFPSLLGLFPVVELPSFPRESARGVPCMGKLRHSMVRSALCSAFPLAAWGSHPVLSPMAVGRRPYPQCGARKDLAVPWPSPACPHLIPLPQTLSLTPADKSHFQDGLIQFSTDFLLGPVTYGSPAGAGQHVTPQRPPSLEQLSTGCCSPNQLHTCCQCGRGPHPALARLHQPAHSQHPGRIRARR